jgi:hypothetical protein
MLQALHTEGLAGKWENRYVKIYVQDCAGARTFVNFFREILVA